MALLSQAGAQAAIRSERCSSTKPVWVVAGAEGVMGDDPAQKVDVGDDAFYTEFAERSQHLVYGRAAIAPVRHQLGDHGVVETG